MKLRELNLGYLESKWIANLNLSEALKVIVNN